MPAHFQICQHKLHHSSNYKVANERVHDTSDGHSKAVDAKIAKQQMQSTPLAVIQRRNTWEQQEKFQILFNTAYCVAKLNLSFRDFPMLCQLQAKNGLQIRQNYLVIFDSTLKVLI